MSETTAAQSATGSPTTAGKSDYLRIEGITKDFDGFLAVDNVDITIAQGEIFALLGASGCGKSTLLRMLAGFERPTSGKIILDGNELNGAPPYERPVNMMFQSYALFPHMSVEQNIAFGLKQDGVAKAEIKDRVLKMLRLVQMESYARRKPHQLSGGQQQRVALARSLSKSPKLLLLDEPMGALDKKLRTQMQLEVVDIIESLGVTCVMVTHDQEEAMTMASRIAVMESGRIRQIGAPDEIYEQPTCRFTAEFIGSVNLIDGRIKDDLPDYATIQSPDLEHLIYVGHGLTGFEDMPVSYALRPEKIIISKAAPEGEYNRANGEIVDIAYLGSHSVFHVKLASGKVILVTMMNAERWASERFTWNDQVWLSWEDKAGVVLSS